MRMESPLNQRLRRSPPDVVYTPIDVTSMLDEAAKPEAPFKEILVWKFSRFTRKREHAVAFKSMLVRGFQLRLNHQ